ncbi:hypothetical protein SOM26_00820 [Sphingomonas sp. CFBP8993]|uniref:hypothetical protein n=1 Tax=Sphingomonas sp. CFBP8993 TaxID=3096526 RepID=UPI002A6B1C6F|nr:hypothetical protein [Sphingomonas sp. CFBP8993]MDY0957220.1 hypothetical protein [Sphingomonas sp. CFBP8993]
MTRDSSMETLWEVVQALDGHLARLDQAQLGQLAACYLKQASDILKDEALGFSHGCKDGSQPPMPNSSRSSIS